MSPAVVLGTLPNCRVAHKIFTQAVNENAAASEPTLLPVIAIGFGPLPAPNKYPQHAASGRHRIEITRFDQPRRFFLAGDFLRAAPRRDTGRLRLFCSSPVFFRDGFFFWTDRRGRFFPAKFRFSGAVRMNS